MKKGAKKEASPTDLVDKLLDGGPRQATDAYMKLSALVSDGLDIAPLLEKKTSADDNRRYWIGDLVADAHRRHGRMSEWRAWLERCNDDRVTGGQFMSLGNDRRRDPTPYLPVVLTHLRNPDSSARVCGDSLYFLIRLGERQPNALDEGVRDAIAERLDDKRRIQYGTVAGSARKALEFCGGASPSKGDPRVAKATRALGDKRAAVRARAAAELVSLVSDAIDIRSSFAELAKALTDSAVSVRRPAALAAYYAFDMQRGIRELHVLEKPLAQAARDRDKQVRERAEMALAAQSRGQSRGRD
jgi:hypothetical protein